MLGGIILLFSLCVPRFISNDMMAVLEWRKFLFHFASTDAYPPFSLDWSVPAFSLCGYYQLILILHLSCDCWVMLPETYKSQFYFSHQYGYLIL